MVSPLLWWGKSSLPEMRVANTVFAWRMNSMLPTGFRVRSVSLSVTRKTSLTFCSRNLNYWYFPSRVKLRVFSMLIQWFLGRRWQYRMWYCRLQRSLRTGSSDLDFSFKGFNFCMHSSSQKQPECYNLISCLQILCVDTGFEVDFFFFSLFCLYCQSIQCNRGYCHYYSASAQANAGS